MCFQVLNREAWSGCLTPLPSSSEYDNISAIEVNSAVTPCGARTQGPLIRVAPKTTLYPSNGGHACVVCQRDSSCSPLECLVSFDKRAGGGQALGISVAKISHLPRFHAVLQIIEEFNLDRRYNIENGIYKLILNEEKLVRYSSFIFFIFALPPPSLFYVTSALW